MAMDFNILPGKKNGHTVCKYCHRGDAVGKGCTASVPSSTLIPPFVCCREADHTGPHVACGTEVGDHPIVVWTGEKILKCTVPGYSKWRKRVSARKKAEAQPS